MEAEIIHYRIAVKGVNTFVDSTQYPTAAAAEAVAAALITAQGSDTDSVEIYGLIATVAIATQTVDAVASD